MTKAQVHLKFLDYSRYLIVSTKKIRILQISMSNTIAATAN